ncbi:MAG: hypothetical protein K8R39_12590 [Arcobacteraceae bacterium]|nr:hypothetical protein [Arcobacteraceae bacterium]
MDSMMIPFIMLLIVTIALVLERKHHEDKIVNIYEDKFEQWKEHATLDEYKPKPKELVGLVFLENEQLNIELLDDKVLDRLERKKYSIKQKG